MTIADRNPLAITLNGIDSETYRIALDISQLLGGITGTIAGIIAALVLGFPSALFLPLIGGIFGFFMPPLVAAVMIVEPAQDEEKDDFVKTEARDDDLHERAREYPHVGEYIVTEILDVYSPEGDDCVKILVDLPDSESRWHFDFPHTWNDDNGLVSLAESYGYDEESFAELVGEPVLVTQNWSDHSSTTWTMKVYDAQTAIEDIVTKERLSSEDVQADLIEEQYSLSVPLEKGEEGIVVEDMPEDVLPDDEDFR